MFGRSRHASMAAEPVSPDVATTMRDPFGPATQLGVEHPPEQLEGDVLERERRAVEELEQPHVLIELDERAHGLVVERRIRVSTHRCELFARHAVDERPHDVGRDACVGRCRRDLGQRGPRLGDVQAPVGRESSDQRLREVERPVPLRAC